MDTPDVKTDDEDPRRSEQQARVRVVEPHPAWVIVSLITAAVVGVGFLGYYWFTPRLSSLTA